MKSFPQKLVPGFLSAAFALFPTLAPAGGPVRLITEAEAKLPLASEPAGATRNLTRGPGVERIAPPPVEVEEGPFRLAVKFTPRNSVPIDPASVRVTYLRNPAVDLTARVKAFITAEGIDAPEVIVPPGRHDIVVEASDTAGRSGRALVVLTAPAPVTK